MESRFVGQVQESLETRKKSAYMKCLGSRKDRGGQSKVFRIVYDLTNGIWII